MSVQDGCVLVGSRVTIPSVGWSKVMDELHEGHPGISRIKGLAKSVVWWPGIDSDLEKKVKECWACEANRKSPALAPLHTWDWPSCPWTRLHIDHAGPFLGKTFLVVCACLPHSLSGWRPECVCLPFYAVNFTFFTVNKCKICIGQV